MIFQFQFVLSFSLIISVLCVNCGDNDESLNYTLPDSVKPSRYEIFLNLTDDKEFNGTIFIYFKVNEKNFHYLYLNGKDLEILDASVFNVTMDDKSEIFLKNKTINNTEENIILYFDKQFHINKEYKLKILYKGLYQTSARGIFRTGYNDSNNIFVPVIATKFGPIYARYAFPCFDQPEYKSVFHIELIHNKKYKALSNTKVLEEKPGRNENEINTVFEDTPLMSTYLVSFIISNYEYVEYNDEPSTETRAKVLHRVYTNPTRINDTKFALNISVKLLRAYEEILNRTYELSKIDHVDIPLLTGAMENWGMITYSSNLLLYNPIKNSINNLKDIIITISHELAHQYFGNLVTPEGWKYLWLSEGMAQYYGYIMADLIYPEYKIGDDFVTKVLQKGFLYAESDNNSISRSLTCDVYSPDDIINIFDGNTYDKAASILYMIRNAIGDDIFTNAIRNYVEEGQLGTANDTLLNNALTNKIRDSHIWTNEMMFATMEMVMDTWTIHKEHPILNVAIIKNITGNYYNISQRSFSGESNATWFIPFNFITKSEVLNNIDLYNKTTADYWLPNITSIIRKIEYRLLAPKDWIIFNKKFTGFYRVNYDMENWNYLINELTSGNHKLIHRYNRLQLLIDAFHFAEQHSFNYPTYLKMFFYLKKEKDFPVWQIANKIIKSLDRYLVDTDTYKAFMKFVRELTEDHYKDLGMIDYPNDDYNDRKLRKLMIELACKYGNENCLKDAFKYLQEEKTEQKITPYLRSVVYLNGMRNALNDEFKFIFKLIHETTDLNEKNEYLTALSSTWNTFLINNLTDIILSENGKEYYDIKLNLSMVDRQRMLLYIIGNGKIGLNVFSSFLKQKHSDFVKFFNDEMLIINILSVYAARISETEKIENLKEIMQIHSLKHLDDLLKNIQKNTNWIFSHQSEFQVWFNQNLKPDQVSGAGSFILSFYSILICFVVVIFVK